MRRLLFFLVVGLGIKPSSAQLSHERLYFANPSRYLTAYAPYATNLHRPASLMNLTTSPPAKAQTSLWQEMGYIATQQTIITGLSYLASRKKYGPAIAGALDIVMGLTSMESIPHKESSLQKTGYALIAAGFLAKSLYNFKFGKKHDKNVRFWANYISFNVLVYAGYALDE